MRYNARVTVDLPESMEGSPLLTLASIVLEALAESGVQVVSASVNAESKP